MATRSGSDCGLGHKNERLIAHYLQNRIIWAFSLCEVIAPPSALGLMFPIGPIHVPSTVQISSSGFTGGNHKEYVNFTSKALMAPARCGGGPLFGSGFTPYGPFLVDQEGTYTIQWNVTYGIPFVPYEANSTTSDCNPGPYSYQSLVLNKTFTTSGKAYGTVIETAVTTVTSSFATLPTGQVVFLNGARGLSGMYLMSVLPVVVVLGVFSLL
ncbi:hypothetical protein BDP27DRAFT_1401475 [Rhodocollybia butyracea]|uniref:Uncharacterized protein n=1 Tax=Rhodocollybia butyracea TaxID=206335 RepID=A0A9P5PS54_9AGAR|nr:hypothetical protein BDP27DRAFT_1401475 [Rhodocollybia butyracea]